MGGGGMGGGGGGMGGGGGGGFFNVAPEAVELKAATVCLEHGKAEPRAAIPYEIRPLESVTSNPLVQEVCRLLGQGAVNQRVAQVAAWHLNNNMSWEQLANKQLRYANGQTSPYFRRRKSRRPCSWSRWPRHLAQERAKDAPSQRATAIKGTSQDPARRIDTRAAGHRFAGIRNRRRIHRPLPPAGACCFAPEGSAAAKLFSSKPLRCRPLPRPAARPYGLQKVFLFSSPLLY